MDLLYIKVVSILTVKARHGGIKKLFIHYSLITFILSETDSNLDFVHNQDIH